MKKNHYINLVNFRKNNYSQNGEDGIINELIKRLKLDKNPNNNWCVEFGAWDGIHLSNTYNLVKNGWNAIYIEGDIRKFKDLLKTKSNNEKIIAVNKFVSKNKESDNSLDNILKKTNIPINFDILSIDIDSFDLEVWYSLITYKPKIVIIEINSAYPPGIIKWHSERNSNTNGNSFSATLKVAEEKGYRLIFHTGNMLFIKEELFDSLRIDPKYLNHPELLYDDTWYSIEKSILKKFIIRCSAFLKEKINKKIKKLFLK